MVILIAPVAFVIWILKQASMSKQVVNASAISKNVNGTYRTLGRLLIRFCGLGGDRIKMASNRN